MEEEYTGALTTTELIIVSLTTLAIIGLIIKMIVSFDIRLVILIFYMFLANYYIVGSGIERDVKMSLHDELHRQLEINKQKNNE